MTDACVRPCCLFPGAPAVPEFVAYQLDMNSEPVRVKRRQCSNRSLARFCRLLTSMTHDWWARGPSYCYQRGAKPISGGSCFPPSPPSLGFGSDAGQHQRTDGLSTSASRSMTAAIGRSRGLRRMPTRSGSRTLRSPSPDRTRCAGSSLRRNRTRRPHRAR